MNDRAARELHRPDVSFAADFDFQPFAKRVDGGDADSVQATGTGFIAARSIELATGMDFREHDFEGRLATLFRHASDGNTSAVVNDRDAAIGVDLHRDRRRVLVDRFVDAVIDDLVNQVMQAASGRVADVHRRAVANAFDPFKGLDLSFVIGIGGGSWFDGLVGHKFLETPSPGFVLWIHS